MMKLLKSKLTIAQLVLITLFPSCFHQAIQPEEQPKPRVIVTSDGEIDDECSMVRFLLCSNEWDIEGIVTSSSQYHWRGHRWAGDDWLEPYLNAYAEVYPNLVEHDKAYPSPEYLRSVTFLGNVDAEGEMDSITPGSQHIASVLLDTTENDPIWIQAWGGINTISRALKTIEENHPEQMEYVAGKIRFFFIWEQDSTYQSYIRPHWGKYQIQTIVSDQFWAIAYQWDKILPEDKQHYFKAEWMKEHILEGHGALCSLYKAHVHEGNGLTDYNDGDFRSEGDSPSFLHTIPTGLRNLESPGYGGWGGRYVNVLANTWLDPVPVTGYEYPEGRWYGQTAWGIKYMYNEYPENLELMREYFKPLVRWTDALQNDFAARADWCVKPYKEANHQPVVKLDHDLDLSAAPGSPIQLSARGSYDPDGDDLTFNWWFYEEASGYQGEIEIKNSNYRDATIAVPDHIDRETTLHVVCEVKDNGIPQLTRYQRVIIIVEP